MELKTASLKLQTLNLDTVLRYSLITGSLLIPLLISKPQLLVGSAINVLILVSTFKYGVKKSLPIYILPSVTSLLRGLLFGGATVFLAYLIPFIILSNLIFGYIANTKKNILTISLGAILKTLFLFSTVYVLIHTIGLPSIFLQSMGYMQLITGIVGGVVTLLLLRVTKA